MTTQAVEKRACRSHDACVGGVCAGLAKRFDLDPIVTRILAILITVMTFGLGGIVYLILWARLPREANQGMPFEITPESAESSALGCIDCATGRAVKDVRKTNVDGASMLARLAVAVALLLLFLLIATNLSPFMPGTEWWQFWPVGLLMLGLCLIIIPIPTHLEMAWHSLGIVVTSLAATLLPMSLGVMSWHTIPCAFEMAWPLVVGAVIAVGFGAYRGINALMVVGAFLIVAFCVIALTACALPGEMETLLFNMPDGRSLQISFVNS
ncbi:MAG: PspC domain-containing protein [Eggerthellaceae bacterium]|nr:PspC domain-containing protein [Eggerthellaceae bacterium]